MLTCQLRIERVGTKRTCGAPAPHELFGTAMCCDCFQRHALAMIEIARAIGTAQLDAEVSRLREEHRAIEL